MSSVPANSALAFVTGIACVLMPTQLLASYDVSLAPMGLVIYQFWGAALIGLGMLTWFARSVRESALQRKFALALFITNGLSCVMAVRGQFAGANTFGWSTVALFFLLALGFGAFMLIKPYEFLNWNPASVKQNYFKKSMKSCGIDNEML